IGWEGELEEAVELAHGLRPLVDGLAVCLDLAQRVRPRLGLEGHIGRQSRSEPRWAAFLDELVRRGWCTSSKRDALLDWPGLVSPADRDRAWPPELVCASLRRPADHFTSFQRLLSHVKVVYEPGRPTEAKGYFGFEHAWLRPGLDRDEAPRPGR